MKVKHMTGTLKNLLSDLTADLNEKAAREKIFNLIRDFEYKIILGNHTIKDILHQVMEDEKGFCLSKHYLMGELFSMRGYEVKYCTYSFNWADAGLDLPDEIKTIAIKLPITYHTAIKVLIDGNWVLLDATWDRFLNKAGFPVNKWDGESSTDLAVKHFDEIEKDDIHAHHSFYRKKMSEYTLKEKVVLARFTKLFNAWVERLRKNEIATF